MYVTSKQVRNTWKSARSSWRNVFIYSDIYVYVYLCIHLDAAAVVPKLFQVFVTVYLSIYMFMCILIQSHIHILIYVHTDLDAAAAGLMASKFRNAGQTCVCTNRCVFCVPSVCVYVCVFMFVCMCVWVCVCVIINAWHMQKRPTYIYRSCMYVHIHICICTNTCTYAYINKHISFYIYT